MLVSHFRSWEMVVPRSLKVSTVDKGLLDVVRGSSAEGCLMKSTVIHSLERVQLQIVLTAPEHLSSNFLPICRLITILDESDDRSVVCKLQKCNGSLEVQLLV